MPMAERFELLSTLLSRLSRVLTVESTFETVSPRSLTLCRSSPSLAPSLETCRIKPQVAVSQMGL